MHRIRKGRIFKTMQIQKTGKWESDATTRRYEETVNYVCRMR
jgi:hypothetical protein